MEIPAGECPLTCQPMQRLTVHPILTTSLILCAFAGRITAQPLSKPNPAYDLTNFRPAGLEPQVSGMDFLPDGRLVLVTHEPVRANPVPLGAVYVLSQVESGPATFKKAVSGTFSATGLLVQDGLVYLAEKDRLVEIQSLDAEFTLSRTQDEVAGKYRTIHRFGWDDNYHQFSFGPLYRQGFFYVALSTAWPENLNKSKNRAALLKIAKATGAVDTLLSGIRTPNGLGFGPEEEIFATDNQGGWLPPNKLNNLRPGRFYGFFNNAGGKFDKEKPAPAAVFMPYGEASKSPTDPTWLKQGPYAGQLLMGDIAYGGLHRVFLEKVNGEYQGALFKFSGGLEAGVNQIVESPDGTLYLGGMGSQHYSGWSVPGGKYFSLQKMKLNSKSNFDFLAVRSLGPKTLELEFTDPVATAGANAANFAIKTWHYNPTASYGGPKVSEANATVRSATLNATGNRITLEVDGLATGKVVHIRINALASRAGGNALWSNQAWYTMNHFGPGQPVATRPTQRRSKAEFAAFWHADRLRLAVTMDGPWNLEIRSVQGKLLQSLSGMGQVSELPLSGKIYPPGMYWLVLSGPGGRHLKKLVKP